MNAAHHSSDSSELSWKNRYDELQRKSAQEIEQLKYQLAELRRLIYGVRSERYIPQNDDQLALFQQEASRQEEVPEEQVSYSRKKAVPKRKPVRVALPADLPREIEVIEPEGLSENARRIGCEITETLEYIPPRFLVHRIERPRYIDHDKPVMAELPSLPLPRSNARASVLAHIAVSKLVDHLPFYRQLNMYNRIGIQLSKSTIGGWFSQTATLLEPLYDTLYKEVLRGDYLQMDESPIQVQDNRKKKALHKGYQWVVHDPIRRLVLFRYDPSRSAEIPKNLLRDFRGTLQTDGYQGYLQFDKPEST